MVAQTVRFICVSFFTTVITCSQASPAEYIGRLCSGGTTSKGSAFETEPAAEAIAMRKARSGMQGRAAPSLLAQAFADCQRCECLSHTGCQAAHLIGSEGVQARGGLVHEQHLGVRHQRNANVGALALPACISGQRRSAAHSQTALSPQPLQSPAPPANSPRSCLPRQVCA